MTFVALHVYVGFAPKHPEVGDIRLASIALPHRVGNPAVERRGGHAVARVDERRDGERLERGREL